MIGPSLVTRRNEKQLSPGAGEATLPGELSKLAGHVSVMFTAGRFRSRWELAGR